jgi:hypothetical protein
MEGKDKPPRRQERQEKRGEKMKKTGLQTAV